jgi:cytoskeletal protein CcmA (bactofilin family)
MQAVKAPIKLRHRLLTKVLMIGLFLLFVVAPVFALEALSGNEVVVAAGHVITDDLYINANRFVLDGDVEGDLIISALQAEINGTVGGDLMMMGGHLVINGTVQDDVRFFGRSVLVTANGHIKDDLVFTGYSLETQVGSSVEGNLALSSYKALLAGSIVENVFAGSNGLRLQGHVGGVVRAKVNAPSDEPFLSNFADLIPPRFPSPAVAWGLVVDETAQIDGSLVYTATAEAFINPGATVNPIIFDRLVIPEEELAAQQQSWRLRLVRRLFVLSMVGLMMVTVAPAWTEELGTMARSRPLPNMGWGVVAFLLMGLVFVFAEAMILGVVVGLGLISFASLVNTGITLLVVFALLSLVLFLFLLVICIAISAVSYWGGQFVLRHVTPAWAERHALALLTGVVTLVLLGAIPVLGPTLYILVILLGLGAIFLWGRDNF